MNSACLRALRIGLASARANAMPMLVLWGLAVALVMAYYFVPCSSVFFAPLQKWQETYGILAAFVTKFVFCGLLPAVFLLAFKSIRIRFPIWKAAAISVWTGTWGVVYLGFYSFQCQMFGNGSDFGTLLYKTAFDEFVWAPCVVMPLSSLFFLWLGCDFSFSRTLCRCRDGFVMRVMLPNLVSNWCVWIPAVLAIYAFPLPLQVQMLGLVSSFWSLMCLQIGRRVQGECEDGHDSVY